ncbi:MAG: YihY family inner membrane protein [Betaproteobacteria bacterium]|nr:YihY family inner membrane protein [Betaproteobacteria bacterium]
MAISPREWWSLVKTSIGAWSDDYAPSMGAAIAYYTVFSLAPLLLLVIAVAGFFFGREAVQGEVVGQIQGLMGQEGAVAVEGLLKSASEPQTSAIAAIASILLLIFGATTVFAEIQNALDRIWKVPAARKPAGVWGFIRTRLLSFGLVLGLAFLLLVSLIVSAAVAALGTWWGQYFEGQEALLQLVNLVVSLVLSTALFSMIYKLMPRTPIAWRDVWIGATVTAVLFEIGKFLIGLYLGKSGVTSGFGAAGSLAVLLIWVYYSAQIFLLGAEFTRAYALAHGSGHEPSANATSQENRRQRRELRRVAS